ncbi:MAG TPA: glycosyltransferase [Candidatus Binatia bacterium]|jgi:GT2 family glycosyltransferase|nr:glycosyltransferase [Candidatus Binatia bacterium]
MTASRATIVVCTLDRAPYLRRLLERLRTLDHPAFEVVVVAGPSHDATPEVLREVAGRVKVVVCAVANLGRSRNLGIAAAAGDVVAFIDDDALPAASDWLRALVGVLDEDRRLGGVGGPVLIGDGDDWEFEGRLVSAYAEMRTPFEAAAEHGNGTTWFPAVQGNNCAFRRDALFAIGGFDEAFTYHFDETDVCVRLARLGRPIAYAPTGVVRHARAPSHSRRSPYDLDWESMARADVYFALKTAVDDAPHRLLEVLRIVRTKYPFRLMSQYYWEGHFGTARRALYLARWGRGVVAGAWTGLVRARQTPLSLDTAPPLPFLPFRRS